MSVGSKVARASQARNPYRIKKAIEGFRIEAQARGVEISGARRQARNEKLRIGRAVDMASGTAQAGSSRDATQNRRRIERHVPEIDQIGLATSDEFRSKHFARASERILVELGAGGQHRFGPAQRKRNRIPKRQGQQKDERRDE